MKSKIQENKRNNYYLVSKNLKNIGLVFLATLALTSCSNDDNSANEPIVPTAQAFSNLQNAALASVTQNFSMVAENGLTTFTSTNGVVIKINGTNLRKNGNPVTGNVNIEYAEVFDGGKMLTTDKTTMGMQANGQMGLIISGGEFFLKATQGNVELTTVGPIQLIIPTTLTGGPNPAMTLWTGQAPTAGANMLGWIATDPGPTGAVGVIVNGQGTITPGTYNAALPGFGWTNVDRFYNDPRPRTQLLATVPSGYNEGNSAIYLHYDGQGNSLAKFDKYLTATQQFSEHYGQIPIGLVCHAIFVTEDNGQWRYAIKAFTVQSGDIYNFTLAETTLGNQAQLEAAINALP
ncbi:hypothetical protein OX283_005480 [Flavobacterium sp. SUN052]|uniref:hypothetical protein n=1 Tax=Flavobacterium sp. SUN052 TaxID=3002441 RepID=UPI00237E1651|nr:hypothetical protein [Flavobacterium sp. SUN052]MEC4004097.1 hypothetical protein [Flavobacterium sp. SUN052]